MNFNRFNGNFYKYIINGKLKDDTPKTLQTVANFFKQGLDFSTVSGKDYVRASRLTNGLEEYATLFVNKCGNSAQKQRTVYNFLNEEYYYKSNKDLEAIFDMETKSKKNCSFNIIYPTEYLESGECYNPHAQCDVTGEPYEILFFEFNFYINTTRKNAISNLQKFLNDYCGEEI